MDAGGGQRFDRGNLPLLVSTLFSHHGLSLNLELTDWLGCPAREL